MKLTPTGFLVLFLFVCHLTLDSDGAADIHTFAEKQASINIEKGKQIKENRLIFNSDNCSHLDMNA